VKMQCLVYMYMYVSFDLNHRNKEVCFQDLTIASKKIRNYFNDNTRHTLVRL